MDFYNLMFYDSHGIWHDHAGHNAPLYRAGDICSRNCADMLAYLERGKRIPRGKMNMGVPFYGFRYDRIRRFYEQGQDCGGEYLTYSQVERTAARGWTRRFDKKCRVPYLVKNGGRGIITYDDPGSIREKVRFARENRLAGVFMWEVSQDYDKGRTPLLDAMREEFRKSFGA
jgi:chitinase